jgi:hypothetical protein
LVLVSCKKDESGPGGEVNQTDLFNITDNGESHNFTRLIKRHQDGIIGIAVPTSLGSGYALGIADSLNEGIYSLYPDAPVQLTKLEGTGKVVYTQQSGTLTIATHDRIDRRISGSFSGILVDDASGNTATITNGQFVSNY